MEIELLYVIFGNADLVTKTNMRLMNKKFYQYIENQLTCAKTLPQISNFFIAQMQSKTSQYFIIPSYIQKNIFPTETKIAYKDIFKNYDNGTSLTNCKNEFEHYHHFFLAKSQNHEINLMYAYMREFDEAYYSTETYTDILLYIFDKADWEYVGLYSVRSGYYDSTKLLQQSKPTKKYEAIFNHLRNSVMDMVCFVDGDPIDVTGLSSLFAQD